MYTTKGKNLLTIFKKDVRFKRPVDSIASLCRLSHKVTKALRICFAFDINLFTIEKTWPGSWTAKTIGCMKSILYSYKNYLRADGPMDEETSMAIDAAFTADVTLPSPQKKLPSPFTYC